MACRFSWDWRWEVLVVVMALALLGAHDLHAESMGSPAGILKKGRWTMGLGGGALVDRGMELAGSSSPEATIYHGGHFRGYGLTDWLSLYGQIGGASLEVTDGTTTNDFGGVLLLSAQVRGRFWRHEKTDFEWDGSLHVMRLRSRHTGDNEGDWDELQLATSVAKGFGSFKPYLGVKVSVIDFDFTLRKDGVITRQDSYTQDGTAGFFMGSDFYLGKTDNVVLNVETAFVDGTEVTMGLSYIF